MSPRGIQNKNKSERLSNKEFWKKVDKLIRDEVAELENQNGCDLSELIRKDQKRVLSEEPRE